MTRRGAALAAAAAALLLGGCGVDGPPVAPQPGQGGPGQDMSAVPSVSIGGRVAAGVIRAD